MTRRRPPTVRWMLAVVLAGTMMAAATPVPASAGSVSVHVSCYTDPERTTITNGTGHLITIQRIGSTYRPYVFEPFHRNKLLKAGHSFTYQTGKAAKLHILTHNYIYYDNNGVDGVRVRTSVGIFKRAC